MGKIKVGVAVVLAAYVIAIFVQNSGPVDFKFLFLGEIQVSRTLLVIISALIGSVLTLIVQFAWRRRKRPTAPVAVPSPGPLPPA